MGFTAVAFIHKNTPELRKKLEELGYKSVSLMVLTMADSGTPMKEHWKSEYRKH